MQLHVRSLCQAILEWRGTNDDFTLLHIHEDSFRDAGGLQQLFIIGRREFSLAVTCFAPLTTLTDLALIQCSLTRAQHPACEPGVDHDLHMCQP